MFLPAYGPAVAQGPRADQRPAKWNLPSTGVIRLRTIFRAGSHRKFSCSLTERDRELIAKNVPASTWQIES
jgi:hypothetical protein